MWDTGTGKIDQSLSVGIKVGHNSAAINLDAKLMVAGSPTPGVVWLTRWDLASAQELSTFNPVSGKTDASHK